MLCSLGTIKTPIRRLIIPLEELTKEENPFPIEESELFKGELSLEEDFTLIIYDVRVGIGWTFYLSLSSGTSYSGGAVNSAIFSLRLSRALLVLYVLFLTCLLEVYRFINYH